ncbi:hypothetical protein, variant [Aphanomyces invadans]|uniref:Uncharacterized protein n=1 Tax=Aphanomyces invadans TaxID=157072 RepID=A0A024TBT9_9STRA|nr:hypothetical protein, variant [Aphanomyces invadans]ETV90807.1 hypothetical protein, variant [Aphanomyces invadans]|eukprot:XP_008880564.1 hypothetical protein, variant [Aphanomyces invadans]
MLRRRPSVPENDVAADDDDDIASASDKPTAKFVHRKSSMGRSMSTSMLGLKPNGAHPKPFLESGIATSLLKMSNLTMLSPQPSKSDLQPSTGKLLRQLSISNSATTLYQKPLDMSTDSLTPTGEPPRRDSSKIDAQALFHFRVFLLGDGPYISGAGKHASVDLTPLFPSGQSVMKLSGGIEWGAALMKNHHVYTWGNNTGGQLGHGNTEAVARPTLVAGLQSIRIVKLSCGSAHGGFVSDVGALFMVGDATYGRLGLGGIPVSGVVTTPTQLHWSFSNCRDKAVSLGTWPSSIPLKHLPPEPLSPTTGAPIETCFSDVSCGDRHTLVLVKHMHVLRQVLLGFGDGSNGRLGAGTDVDHPTPNLISTFHTAGGDTFVPVREMVAGPEHNCCISQTGELFTWGHGSYGQLGHTTSDSEWAPKRVEYFHNNANVIAIKQATCDTTGQVFAWGRGDLGQLGCETLADTSTPRNVVFAVATGAPSITARYVTAGRTHNVVVDSLDNMYCWGDNSKGQLGLKVTSGLGCQPTPVQLESKTIQMPVGAAALHLHALSVSAAENHTMLVLRTTSAFDGGDSSLVKAKKAVGMFKSLHAKRKSLAVPTTGPSSKAGSEPQAVKWSFTVAEPTDALKMPSNVDRFLQIMASTKITKRPTPTVENAKTTGGGSCGPSTQLHLSTKGGSPPKQLQSTRPANPPQKRHKLRPTKPIQGLLEWQRAHTKRVSTTFSHAPRFRTKPAVAPTPIAPDTPPEKPVKQATPTTIQLEHSAKTRLLRAFGVGQRFRTVQVSVTPGPGAYDVVPPRKAPPNDSNQCDEGDLDDWRPKPVPFGSTAPKQVPAATVDTTDIYPEKATALVYRKPIAVKLAPADDFSRVISKRLQEGRGTTPGPGAYSLSTTPPVATKSKSTKPRK